MSSAKSSIRPSGRQRPRRAGGAQSDVPRARVAGTRSRTLPFPPPLPSLSPRQQSGKGPCLGGSHTTCSSPRLPRPHGVSGTVLVRTRAELVLDVGNEVPRPPRALGAGLGSASPTASGS